MTQPRRFAVFASLSLGSLALAQTARRPEETVTLSEFTVTETSDNSYVASESITGTRVRTPIKDLTFTVNVNERVSERLRLF